MAGLPQSTTDHGPWALPALK